MAEIEKRVSAKGVAKWRVRWTEHGTRQSMTFDSQADAIEFKLRIQECGGDMRKAAEKFSSLRSQRATLSEVIEGWIEHDSESSPEGKDKMRRIVVNRIEPTIGWRTVGEIEYNHLEQLITEWKTKYSPKTIANTFNLVSAGLNRAVRHGAIPASPATGVRLPKVRGRQGRMLSRTEAERLVGSMDQFFRPLVLTLVWTGLRWGEMEALTVADYERINGTPYITVNKAAKDKKDKTGGRVIGEPKTATSYRTIAVPPEASHSIDKLVEQRDSDGDLIFVSKRGNQLWNPSWRSNYWLDACDRAGLSPLRIHDLRHTHASWLIKSGLDLLTVQRRLGHSSIKVTVDRYGHLRPDAGEATLTALGSI